MFSRITKPSLHSPLLILFLSLTLLQQSLVAALAQSYCSTQNTGTSHALGAWIYQSNGYCYDQCTGYSYAIVQGEQCWCSNTKPSSTVAVGTYCNGACPGYPDDSCGNVDTGYYGYLVLAAGSAATTTKAATTTSTAGVRVDSSTVQKPIATVTQTAAVPLPVSTATLIETTTNLAASADDAKAKTSAAVPTTTSTWVATPVTSLQLITISGAVVTQTVTNTPTAPPDAYPVTKKSSALPPGTIAAAVLGSLAGLILILGAIIFFLRRRRQAASEEEFGAESEKGSKRSPRRNVSVLSKMGLLERIRPVSHHRNSTHTSDFTGVSPDSDRRASHPMFYDQRLNPNALMVHDNGSHVSVGSIQDNRDYTRTLGVRNPDPRPSFEAS